MGLASGWFAGLVLAPFAVLAGVASGALDRASGARAFAAAPFRAPGATFLGALGIGISQSVWNYSGWDNASTVGGEIEESGATYPRALLRALPLVTVVYLLGDRARARGHRLEAVDRRRVAGDRRRP